MTTGSRTAGALIGLSAAAVALAVAELVAVLTGPRSSPLVAVGAVVIDNSPTAVTKFAIDLFGVHDKTALQVGTLVLIAAAAAGTGALAVRELWIGIAGLGGFGAIGVAAVVTRPDTSFAAVFPTLVGVLAGAGAFLGLRRLSTVAAAGDTTVSALDDHARRWFLRAVGLAVGGGLVAGLGGRWFALEREVAAARASVDLPTPVDPAPPVPAGADLDRPNLASYVTGNDSFYRIDTALVVPRVDPRDWELRVHGRVRRPFTINFERLLARPMIERYITLACVSNQVGGSLIGNARWLGVPVAELLSEAEPLPGADQVVGRSVDGWTCGTPTSVLTDGRDALLAVGMNGQPLPSEHGFPVRMVVPGLYGYVSACKWITEIELSSFDDFDAYWVPRGWSARGPIKTQSRIDTPRRRAATGPVTVAGVAWAQHRGIAGVEVRVDDLPWQPATLADTVSADTWRQWSWQWDAPPGVHRLSVRATDETGETQVERRSSVLPDGATGWHTIEVEVS